MSKSARKQRLAACRFVYNCATAQIAVYASVAQTACDEARKLGVASLAAECDKPKRAAKKTFKRTVAKNATIAGAVWNVIKYADVAFDSVDVQAAILRGKSNVKPTFAQVGRALCKLASQKKIRRIDVGLYEVVR